MYRLRHFEMYRVYHNEMYHLCHFQMHHQPLLTSASWKGAGGVWNERAYLTIKILKITAAE